MKLTIQSYVGKTMLFAEGRFNGRLNSYIPVIVLEVCDKGLLLVETLETDKETFKVNSSWLSDLSIFA